MKQFVNVGLEELPIGWRPIAQQRITCGTTGTQITGTVAATLARYRRAMLVIWNEDTANSAYLCRVGEALNNASEIPPTTDQPWLSPPFDTIGTPYYLRSAGGAVVCEVNVLVSTEGEPEELIAGA